MHKRLCKQLIGWIDRDPNRKICLEICSEVYQMSDQTTHKLPIQQLAMGHENPPARFIRSTNLAAMWSASHLALHIRALFCSQSWPMNSDEWPGVGKNVQRLGGWGTLPINPPTSARQPPHILHWIMTDRLLQIALGTMLGDASLQRNRSKKVVKWRLKFLQSQRHEEYVRHLHKEFRDYVKAPPFFDKSRMTYSFTTLFNTDFSPLATIFLDERGKKHISRYFEETPLAPISLAYWFMDDGGLLSYNKDWLRRGTVLNTHGFSKRGCELLRDNLNDSFGFHCRCKGNRGKTIIAFPAGEWEKLWETISPHVIDSMHYKFPLGKNQSVSPSSN